MTKSGSRQKGMSTLFKRLGESLPERRPPSKDTFQADPRQLKRWLDALPLANAGVAARMLYQALRVLICDAPAPPRRGPQSRRRAPQP